MFKPHVFEVVPDVFCVYRQSYFNCSYFIRDAQGVILIDAGMKSDGSDMIAGLKFAKIDPSEIRAILITHWHNDHTAGVAAMKALAPKSKVYCHEGDEDFLNGKKAGHWLKKLSDRIPEYGPMVLFKGLLGGSVPNAVAIDERVKDGQVLYENFEVIETPGHTPGHVSYYHRAKKILFAGDALACIDEKIRFMARFVTPDLSTSRESMIKLFRYEIETICPGHRLPLKKNVPQECLRMKNYIESAGKWPLFG